MKSARLLLIAALTLLGTMAFAQSDAHKMAAPPVPSDAQKSFDQLKTLAGTWTGPVTADPPATRVEQCSRAGHAACDFQGKCTGA